jgi:peptidoglycan/LPS O-acetylase OafA/YrhL
LGVYIFFTISGYLIAESWDRDPNIGRFFARRALRIFPGLTACVLLTVFVLGPCFTTLSLAEYFSNSHTWQYLRNVALNIVYFLPGVFQENLVPNAVNGSLWSLPVEFIMYVMVSLAGVMHGGRWLHAGLAVLSCGVSYFWAQRTEQPLAFYGIDVREIFICGAYFWVGATVYKFGLRRHFSLYLTLLASAALFVLARWTPVLAFGAWVLLPLAVLSFGFDNSAILNRFTRSGDYSYGIYIYAFPIQQSVVHLWPSVPVTLYILICGALTLACAILSWHLIEKRALAFKPGRRLHSTNSSRAAQPGAYLLREEGDAA